VVKPLSESEQALFARGKTTYETLCAACHQPDGRGLAGLAPPVADSEWVLGPDSRLARIVLHGVTGKMKVLGITYELDMPPLPQLADEDIAGVLTYLRRSWDHGASPVSVERVKSIRAETTSRDKPWTQRELEAIR
jgi:mono/diheme cytochrome c family protein